MFLTRIVEGKVTELALCADCARKKGLFDPQNLTFAEQMFPEKFRTLVDDLVRKLDGDEHREPAEAQSSLPDLLTRCRPNHPSPLHGEGA